MTILRATPLLLVMLLACGSTCQKQPDGGVGATSSGPVVTLPAVDTSSLTPREQTTWSAFVTELMAPCPDVAVNVAECVRTKRPCASCLPAAKLLLRWVRAGAPQQDVADMFAARFDPAKVKTIVLDGSPAKGAADGSVTVVEFADFECPGCGMAYPLIEKVYQRRAKKMRLVFKHFPLAIHPYAKLAAQAAYAAQRQRQFWRMHRKLFENQNALNEQDLVGYATELGLDVERFKKDMHSDGARRRVERDLKQGKSLGVAATPTLYINGRECDLAKLGRMGSPIEDLEQWIDLEARLGSGKGSAQTPAGVGAASASSRPSATAPASASGAALPSPPAPSDVASPPPTEHP